MTVFKLFASFFGKIFGGVVRINNLSMMPACHPGEYFFYEKRLCCSRSYQIGDVVIIKSTHSKQWTIKRVIAIASDSVDIIGQSIFVNKKSLSDDSNYMANPDQLKRTWTVDSGELFVLGDNRRDSTDSRSYGAINIDLVEGRAWLRFWPLNRLGIRF